MPPSFYIGACLIALAFLGSGLMMLWYNMWNALKQFRWRAIIACLLLCAISAGVIGFFGTLLLTESLLRATFGGIIGGLLLANVCLVTILCMECKMREERDRHLHSPNSGT